jgi:hypothetical protein
MFHLSTHRPGPTFEPPQSPHLAHTGARRRCIRTCVLPTLSRMTICQPWQKVTRMRSYPSRGTPARRGMSPAAGRNRRRTHRAAVGGQAASAAFARRRLAAALALLAVDAQIRVAALEFRQAARQVLYERELVHKDKRSTGRLAVTLATSSSSSRIPCCPSRKTFANGHRMMSVVPVENAERRSSD